MDIIDRNAARKTPVERVPYVKDNEWYRRKHANPREAPIIIGSSDAIGTIRAKANSYEAILDYLQEEVALKSVDAPIFPVRIR